MMKNEIILRGDPSSSRTILIKPFMSKTFVYRTNKEFDQCAELLRNILNVQESRRTFQKASLNEINRKKGQSSSLSKPRATKQQNNPRKLTTNNSATKRKSSSTPVAVLQQLKTIQTLSKQIQTNNVQNHHECENLWNELEQCLSSLVLSLNDQCQSPQSLISIHNELIQLRKELQLTNVHLHDYHQRTRPNHEQYVDSTKKFDSTDLHFHNEQLMRKCHRLQIQLDQYEKTNIRLMKRLTEKDLRDFAEKKQRPNDRNDFLLHEEIRILKEKLFHVYDDLTTLFQRDQTLRISVEEQKHQIQSYQKRFNELEKSAEKLLLELNNRSTEEKLQQFLHGFLRQPESTNKRKSVLFESANRTNSSTSTIADADSMLTSSTSTFLLYQEKKNSRTSNLKPRNPSIPIDQRQTYETDREFDQISDLTSKLFTSHDDDQRQSPEIPFSSSSESLSQPEKLRPM